MAPQGGLGDCTGVMSFAVALCLLAGVSAFSQQPPVRPTPEAAPKAAPEVQSTDQDQPLPGDWGPELLYGILSSPNAEASFGLLRATFAAGPAIIPQLAAALKDDRTAEYAAQSLAFIGGQQSLRALWKLLTDPRDLNLRRFTYGALAEYDSPEATNILFNVINRSDDEPDRTVTETAVIALTVHTDATLPARLLESEKKLQDVVIRDDLENARTVIAERAKYLASPAGRNSGGSIESAVRTYFIPALEPPPGAPPRLNSPLQHTTPTSAAPSPAHPDVSVDLRSVTFSPDKNRALARAVFEDPSAMAYYDFVLEKRGGNWTVASVWLGPEVEKNPPTGAPQ